MIADNTQSSVAKLADFTDDFVANMCEISPDSTCIDIKYWFLREENH